MTIKSDMQAALAVAAALGALMFGACAPQEGVVDVETIEPNWTMTIESPWGAQCEPDVELLTESALGNDLGCTVRDAAENTIEVTCPGDASLIVTFSPDGSAAEGVGIDAHSCPFSVRGVAL
jgi:hypothetical protein